MICFWRLSGLSEVFDILWNWHSKCPTVWSFHLGIQEEQGKTIIKKTFNSSMGNWEKPLLSGWKVQSFPNKAYCWQKSNFNCNCWNKLYMVAYLFLILLQLLLSLAKSLFEEQMILERLVSTIITEAKSLLKCERCTVYLLDLRLYDAVRS